MRSIILLIVFNLTFVKNVFAVQCSVNNPCELGGYFVPPKYNCYQASNNPNDVICTCPNGQAKRNTRCRVCDLVNCGPNGICLERDIFPNSPYFCGCSNGTGSFAIPGPCPIIPTTTTTTTTTTIINTFPPISCLNGGTYIPAVGRCQCPNGFGGVYCEISSGQEMCRYITCANYGVCNPVPTANNGFSIECWCLDGFSGANCELIGNSGGCIPGLCQNGGVCEDKTLGISRFGYCQCPAGFTGRCCEQRYFTCPYSGLFTDSVNCKFGRYYECVNTILMIRSCPTTGFRFNRLTMRCEFNALCA